MLRFLLLAASVVVFATSTISAKVIQVPAQLASIQAGINTANTGDTVLVSPGTYFENINFKGKRIVVASRYLIESNSNRIRETIIDGSRPIHPDSASVALFVSGEDSSSRLIGFTLINGVGMLVPGAFIGGGIAITSGSSPFVSDNIIRDNSAIFGGGIAVRNSSPQIIHNAIVSNSAGSGGGILVEHSVATISHNVFYNNSADSCGGAVLIKSAFVDFIDNSVTNNSARQGGGLFCSAGLWSIEYCNFYQNQHDNFSGCGGTELGDKTWGKNFNLDSTDVYQNIFLEPRYVNPVAFDFSPACNSHLIDAGAAIPESHPTGGAREDIGMFEYPYRSGDLTFDNRINLADATALVNIIFLDTAVPCPIYVGDCDCNRRISVADIIALINYWAGIRETSCLFNLAR